MFEYKMNFDEEYARLVAPMLSPEQRTWYTSFTSSSSVPATWNQFKSAIKARYGVAVMEERNRCAFELMNIRVMPGEIVALVSRSGPNRVSAVAALFECAPMGPMLLLHTSMYLKITCTSSSKQTHTQRVHGQVTTFTFSSSI
ncbi:hypothetical protein V8B55DRAFT_1440461 [Mucor lusitanicus]